MKILKKFTLEAPDFGGLVDKVFHANCIRSFSTLSNPSHGDFGDVEATKAQIR